MSVARFRVEIKAGSASLVIDRFSMMSGCRGRKLSYKSLYWILKYVENRSVSSITLFIPQNSWISVKLLAFGFMKVVEDDEHRMWGVVPMEHLIYQLDLTTNVNSIATYLANKCS